MLLELRALIGAIVAFLVAIAVVFLPWEVVFPAFALVYAGYKYRYHGIRIGNYTSEQEIERAPSWRWLRAAIVAYVVVLVVARLAAMNLFPAEWIGGQAAVDTLTIAKLNTESQDAFLDQVTPIAGVGASVVVPLMVLSYVCAKFRRRLLVGVDSREAAVRASLWESLARVPVYLTWASLATVTPVLVHWRRLPAEIQKALSLDAPPRSGDPLAPVLDDFGVVMLAGHLIPVAVMGAYVVLQQFKYEDETVPEVIGYRGLYAPRPRAETVNIVVPVVLFVLYGGAVLWFRAEALAAGPLLLLPVAVAVLVAANVRGTTTQLIHSPAGQLPGIGADSVVTGLSIGTIVLLVLGAVGFGASGTDPVVASALVYPIVAVPLTYGANRAVTEYQARNIETLSERVQSDPDTISEGEVDHLLVYVKDTNETLRRAAIDGLATVVWASSYREDDAVDVFLSAIDPDDDRFANEGLTGILTLLRDDRAADISTIDRLTSPDVLESIEAHLDHRDRESRELAAEAFCRIVETGFTDPRVRRPPLDDRERLPLGGIEDVVDESTDNQSLADAAVTAFAHLWYRRSEILSRVLTHDDEQRLLEDLLVWGADAGEEARLKAAFAITSGDAAVDAAGVETVVHALDDPDRVVRFVAAHILASSMDRHADRVDPERLLAMLDDEWPPARTAAAEAIYGFVENAPERGRRMVHDIVDHLDRIDPVAAAGAEATLLRALRLVDTTGLIEHVSAVDTVADYTRVENSAISEPASTLLASLVEANPEQLRDSTIVAAIETGLTAESQAVRANCVSAAAAIIAVDAGDGRPFVRGLTLNLSETGQTGKTAVDALARVLDEYPGYGTEVLPEMVAGLRNPTPVDPRDAGVAITGSTVGEVAARLVADITDEGVSRGEILIDPLVDLADHVEGSTHEAVFRALDNLTAEYPDEGRAAVGAATAGIEQGNARVRRLAAHVLANVGEQYPLAVEPVVPNLIVAVDDSDARTRAMALHALNNVVAEAPESVEDDIRRIIGRLDDESSIVRERAAEVIVTIAHSEPSIVDPPAEAADRLRRLERDPAINIDPDTLQTSATAVQKGVVPGEEAEAEGTPATSSDTEVFRADEVGESGSSGDTRVYEPVASNPDESFGGDSCPECDADLSGLGDVSICPECGVDLV